MATTLSTSIALNIASTLVKALSLSSPVDQLRIAVNDSFANGTGAGKANMQVGSQRALAWNANESLDLSGDAAFKDNIGDAVTFLNLKLLVVQNLSATNSLKVGGDANPVPCINGTTPYVTVPAGGVLILYAGQLATGWTVTAGTGDKLKFTDGGENAAGATYNVVIVGETA